MSTTPAGWYQDPENAQALRWWDGARWTADTSARPQPYQAGVLAQQERAPEGADWRTPWIWLVLLLPLLPMLGFFFVDWRGFIVSSATPGTGGDLLADQVAFYTSPGYLVATVGGWLTYALAVVFAYLDWKALRDRGVPRPFHWAWQFIPYFVYGIGRGVVTNRRMGRGIVVTWASIAILVATVLGGLIFAGWIVAVTFAELSTIPGYTTS